MRYDLSALMYTRVNLFFMISITHNVLKHHMSALCLSLVSKGQKEGSKCPRQTSLHPDQFTKLLIIHVQFSIFFSSRIYINI